MHRRHRRAPPARRGRAGDPGRVWDRLVHRLAHEGLVALREIHRPGIVLTRRERQVAVWKPGGQVEKIRQIPWMECLDRGPGAPITFQPARRGRASLTAAIASTPT